MEFPIKGTGPSTWTLTRAKFEEYVEAFPGVDVPAELRSLRQWCRDNPTRRKTSAGMLAFLTKNLGRSQCGARGSPDPPPKRERIDFSKLGRRHDDE